MKFDWTFFRQSDLPQRFAILCANDMALEISDEVSGKYFRIEKTDVDAFTLYTKSNAIQSDWSFVMRADLGRLLYLLGIFKTSPIKN